MGEAIKNLKFKMKNYNVRDSTDLSFEFFLKSIYGERIFHGYSITRLRQECKRLVKTIKRAVELNIETDSFHKSRINLALDELDNAFKDKDFEPAYIIGLVKMVFLLLGDIPNNWNRKKTSQPSDFILNQHRKIVYLQNLRQKVNLIWKAHEYEPYCNTIKRHELFTTYMNENNGEWSLKKFIVWYKKKYPKFYLELF